MRDKMLRLKTLQLGKGHREEISRCQRYWSSLYEDSLMISYDDKVENLMRLSTRR